MTPSRFCAAACALTVTAGLLAGCTGTEPTAPTPNIVDGVASETPAPPDAAPVDYRDWLLQPGDIARPDAGYSEPEPATLNPEGRPGAETLIVSDDSSNAVGITIVILPDAKTAPAGLHQAVTDIVTVRPTAPPTAQAVGDEAVSLSGTSRDGSQAATALMFRSDRAIVRIDVYSLLQSPTPVDYAVDIGQKQAIAVRVGLSAAKHVQ